MKLTERQQQILAAIKGYVRENGFPPTIREIGAAVGIATPNGVKQHLLSLERKGRIRRRVGAARGIQIIEGS